MSLSLIPSIQSTSKKSLPSTVFTKSAIATVIAIALLPAPSIYAADHNETSDSIETLTVTSDKLIYDQRAAVKPNVDTQPDVSQWLSSLPGAEINQNGKLTGIAQYRGLYGDRVAVKLNGRGIIGAGPNAMDTPLSYSPGITTESISVYRGIAPVSAAIETLGGAVIVENVKAQLSTTDKWTASGEALASYADVNEGKKIALRSNVANKTVGIMAYIDSNEGEDTESGNGETVKPTGYSKIQSGVDVRWQATHANLIGFSYDYTDTQNAGTPALPMDIVSIFGHRFNLDGEYALAASTLTWQLGYMEADHVMDNFSERENSIPEKFRLNTTDSQTLDFSLKYNIHDAYGNTPWQFGLEGFTTEHNAIITNPNNAMFEVVNFNEVEETKLSAYAQWDTMLGAQHISSGIRVNYAEADAQEVSHHMAMMNPNIEDLVNKFNNAERNVDDIMVDMNIEVQHSFNENFAASVGVARKERAPSYQERYLWIPMEATAGLADGNTYIGDINLDSEVAYQTNLGLSYQQEGFSVTADSFYQYIDDYIQGLPVDDMALNMIASMMMGDDNLLQFSNVDARLYGFDGAVSYQMNTQWSVNAMASYVRGKRADMDDNLYRITPLNGTVTLAYQQQDWQHKVTMHTVASQNKVSHLNQEEASAGYTKFGLTTEYQGFDDVHLSAGIENLFDKAYANHLGGYNRVNDATVSEKDRIPADGRNIWLGVRYSF